MVQPVFDEQLFNLKHMELAPGLHKKTQAAMSRARFERRKLGQGMTVGFYSALADAQIEVLREHLKDVDRICREVWRTQGGIETPQFVRAVVRNRVFTAIAARFAGIEGEIKLEAMRTRFEQLAPVLGHLAREKGQLESIMSNRYEIEARELELRAKHEAAKVAEASHAQAGPVGSDVVPSHAERGISAADLWRDFRDQFKSLSNEERSVLRGTREDRRLRVYCSYNSDRTAHESQLVQEGTLCLLYRLESGQWEISEGPSEDIKARFEAQAARAGKQLGNPSGIAALDFWLHSLCRDLRRTDSRKLFAPGETGGIIMQVCEASATFCSRLEKQALEQTEPGKRRVPQSQQTGRGLADATDEQSASAPQFKQDGLQSRRVTQAVRQPVELGKGGVKFVRQGDYTVALPCGSGGEASDSSTVGAVRVSYDILCAELPKAYSIVKAKGEEISGAELRKQFRRSPLARVADQHDWDGWAEGFSPKNPQRGRPKGAALTFLERKMTLDRGTIKSYLSRSKKPPKQRK